MNTTATATHTAVDYFGTDHIDFTTTRDDANFTYVVWAEGTVLVGSGFPTWEKARGNMMGQLRKFDKKNIGAAGQVREVVKK